MGRATELYEKQKQERKTREAGQPVAAKPVSAAKTPTSVRRHAAPTPAAPFLPCIHRGQELGKLVCNCSNKPPLYDCAAWDVHRCVLVPNSAAVDGHLIFTNGNRSTERYLPESVELPFSEKPMGNALRVPACSKCPRREEPAKDIVVNANPSGIGDMALECWMPEVKFVATGAHVDVAKLFGATVVPACPEAKNIGDSWQGELHSREPRIQYRAKWLGAKTIRRPAFHLDPDAVAWAATLRDEGKQLAVLTPQSWSKTREWPIGHWQALATILQSHDVKVIFDILKPDNRFHDFGTVLQGESVTRMASLLNEADLLITGDTGPAHLAGTMGRPCLLLMGPTLPNSYAYIPSVRVMTGTKECTGCNFQRPKFNQSCHRECASLREMTPASVADRALRLLTPVTVGVCSMATAEFGELREVTRPVLERYCQRHSYPLHYYTDAITSRPPSWSKINVLTKHLADHDWLWWIDADAVITDPLIRLEDYVLDATSDLLIAEDSNGINCGSFLIRYCDWSRDFLTRVWNTSEYPEHPWWEQWTIMQLLKANEDDRKHVQILPKRRINSYQSDWKLGDFVLHMAGSSDKLPSIKAAIAQTAYLS